VAVLSRAYVSYLQMINNILKGRFTNFGVVLGTDASFGWPASY
jgi:Flp pilus assembly pilin Flp